MVSKYAEHFDEIINLIYEEGLSLRKACLRMQDKYNEVFTHRGFDDYLYTHPEETERLSQYARAREARAEMKREEIEDVVEQVKHGEMDSNAARVVIDANKWLCGKMNPKRYGDTSKMEVTGTLNTTIMPAVKVSGEELEINIGEELDGNNSSGDTESSE